MQPWMHLTTGLWTPALIVKQSYDWDPSVSSSISIDGGNGEAGDQVDQLSELLGSTEHLVQATDTAQPTTNSRTQNGLNLLDCNGGDLMEKGSFPVEASGDLTVVMVAVIDVVDATADSIISMAATNDFQLTSGNTSAWNGRLTSSVATDVDFSDPPHAGPSTYGAVFDFAGAGTVEGFVDGTSRGSQSDYTGTKLDTSQMLMIFANRGGGQFPDGAFGEIIITEDVTTATREKIEGYLAHKWGLAANLPTGHTYKTAPPLATTEEIIQAQHRQWQKRNGIIVPDRRMVA